MSAAPPAYVAGQSSEKAAARSVDFDEVRALRAAQVRQLVDLLLVPPVRAETLLRAAGWNVEEAALRVVEAGDNDENDGRRRADDADADRAWKRPRCGVTVLCAVCYEEGPQDAFETDCRDVLCAECWRQYLRAILGDGSNVVLCPMPECQTLVSGELVSAVLAPAPAAAGGASARTTASAGTGASASSSPVTAVADPPPPPPPPPAPAGAETTNAELLDRFLSCQMRDYVSGSSDFRQCPGRDCERVVKRMDEDQAEVECHCGCAFCWKCGLERHFPLDCANARDWILQSSSDAKSQWWIALNTKACPRCYVSIQKNGGCSHMKCLKCGLNFDWLRPKYSSGPGGGACGDQEASGAELRLRAYAFRAHQSQANELQSRQRGVEELAATLAVDAQLLPSALSQALSAHRDLRWVHMALFFLECPPATRTVLDHTVTELEAEVGALTQTLFKTPDEWVKADMLRQVARVDVFRRTVLAMSMDFV